MYTPRAVGTFRLPVSLSPMCLSLFVSHSGEIYSISVTFLSVSLHDYLVSSLPLILNTRERPQHSKCAIGPNRGPSCPLHVNALAHTSNLDSIKSIRHMCTQGSAGFQKNAARTRLCGPRPIRAGLASLGSLTHHTTTLQPSTPFTRTQPPGLTKLQQRLVVPVDRVRLQSPRTQIAFRRAGPTVGVIPNSPRQRRQCFHM